MNLIKSKKTVMVPGKRTGEDIHIIAVTSETNVISPYYTLRSNRVQFVNAHISRLLTLNAQHAVLTIFPVPGTGHGVEFHQPL